MGSWALALCLALLATPAAAAVTLAQLDALQAADQRVMDIAYRLATRGAVNAHCRGATVPHYGLRVHVRGQYPKRDWPVLKRHLFLDRRPGILAVAADGPAAKAGLRARDVIYSVNGQDFLDTDREGYAAITRFDAALTTPRIDLYTLGGRFLIEGVPGCASTVELIPSTKLNAKADGRIVQITTGVVSETRDDDELAFVIAHEMAHNILEHRARLDREGRKARNIRVTEIEADQLALRLMRLANYDPFAAARFWERFGAKTGAGIFSDGTHLRTKERVRLLRGIAAELREGEAAVSDAQ